MYIKGNLRGTSSTEKEHTSTKMAMFLRALSNKENAKETVIFQEPTAVCRSVNGLTINFSYETEMIMNRIIVRFVPTLLSCRYVERDFT